MIYYSGARSRGTRARQPRGRTGLARRDSGHTEAWRLSLDGWRFNFIEPLTASAEKPSVLERGLTDMGGEAVAARGADGTMRPCARSSLLTREMTGRVAVADDNAQATCRCSRPNMYESLKIRLYPAQRLRAGLVVNADVPGNGLIPESQLIQLQCLFRDVPVRSGASVQTRLPPHPGHPQMFKFFATMFPPGRGWRRWGPRPLRSELCERARAGAIADRTRVPGSSEHV
jgi:hypothetical protein